MPLANLYSIPRSPQDWNNWSFNNADSHRRIIEAIFNKSKLQLNYLITDPIPFQAIEDWLRNHQQMHNEMDSVLNIDSSDLTIPQFNDPLQMEIFIFSHADEHKTAEDLLGIS